MKTIITKGLILTGMLLGLPMAGVFLAGYPVERYLEFPPATRYVPHAPFSWMTFAGYSVFILAIVGPIAVQWIAAGMQNREPSAPAENFPAWGWAAIAAGVAAWVLAWNRFSWFAPFQQHTFVMVWLPYIVLVNALAYRASGRCMMTHETRRFLTLFPVSAAFWWFFEYLNRFVQNWRYSGSDYEAGVYFLLATLSFSTVLPAVEGTRQWVATWPSLNAAFGNLRPISIRHSKPFALGVLTVSGAGLLLIGIFPDALFPLLWVSPLLIVVSLQVLMKERHGFSAMERGDFRPVISAAAAALICGFFWEMWNLHSLARWTYAVPLVHRFQIFEMPVLGYAGYLPFGLECMAVAGMIGKSRLF